MNGKGSKPRNCFTRRFRDNYDSINWKKPFFTTIHVDESGIDQRAPWLRGEEFKTGEKWAKELGIKVRDEDGWNPRRLFFTLSISRKEFNQRLLLCTLEGFPHDEEFN